jgi:hypothetical protein
MHNPYIEIKLIYGSMLNLSCGGGYLNQQMQWYDNRLINHEWHRNNKRNTDV